MKRVKFIIFFFYFLHCLLLVTCYGDRISVQLVGVRGKHDGELAEENPETGPVKYTQKYYTTNTYTKQKVLELE